MKKTYIYRVKAGKAGNFEEDFFMYARNADFAKEFCKEIFNGRSFDTYKFIKVGISKTPQKTQIISAEDSKKLRNSQAVRSEYYSERNEVPGVPIDSGVGYFVAKDLRESDEESI